MGQPTEDWRGSELPFSKKWSHVLHEGLYSDVQITVKDNEGRQKIFNGHKILLRITSPVFEAMLSGNFAENDKILIENVDIDMFEIFFRYMYLHTINIQDITAAWLVYDLGCKYLVLPVSKYCMDYIVQNSNPTTCFINYNFAELFSLEGLKANNYELILRNLPTICAKPEFLQLSEIGIKSIINEPVLNISESILFKTIEKWIKAQISQKGTKKEKKQLRKRLIEELVGKIHFLEMTASEFANGVGQSQLLSRNQKLSVLLNLCSEKAVPLEEGIVKFDTNRFKSLECNCSASDYPCKIQKCDFELKSARFEGPSFLFLQNVHLGRPGTKMSFCFKTDTKNSFLLFLTSSAIVIRVNDGNLTVELFDFGDGITFSGKNVADGVPHRVSLAFLNGTIDVKLDGLDPPDISWHYSLQFLEQEYFFNHLVFGYSTNSGSQFCLGSVIIGDKSEVIDMKKYHGNMSGVSLCRCDLSLDTPCPLSA